MAAPPKIVVLLLSFYLSASILVTAHHAHQDFDVRRHLSTVTRYHVAKEISENSVVSSNIPDQCKPIHLNLVARHGTRAPTKKKMKVLDALGTRLEFLLGNVKEQKSGALPSWLRGWKSPWTGKHKGGELISLGESELYELGIRVREKFPQLFHEAYHPDIYPIKATQVSRASASAVAFGTGLFNDRGNLGPGRNRAFAVISESRASDHMLRFHDCCQNYKTFRKNQEPSVDKLKEPAILDEITKELVKRWGLSFTRQDVSSLWFLCKQVELLEWTDDLEVFILKGYGNALNYRMGVPLLIDVIQSMEQAIKAKEDFDKILKEEPLQLPPKPPQKRIWHGSTVAPFARNNMLVLYSCPANNNTSKYFVQVLHNELPTRMAGCGDSDFCPFEVFKEKIAASHLKYDYNNLCSVESKQTTPTNKLWQIYSWLFPANSKQAQKEEL